MAPHPYYAPSYQTINPVRNAFQPEKKYIPPPSYDDKRAARIVAAKLATKSNPYRHTPLPTGTVSVPNLSLTQSASADATRVFPRQAELIPTAATVHPDDDYRKLRPNSTKRLAIENTRKAINQVLVDIYSTRVYRNVDPGLKALHKESLLSAPVLAIYDPINSRIGDSQTSFYEKNKGDGYTGNRTPLDKFTYRYQMWDTVNPDIPIEKRMDMVRERLNPGIIISYSGEPGSFKDNYYGNPYLNDEGVDRLVVKTGTYLHGRPPFLWANNLLAWDAPLKPFIQNGENKGGSMNVVPTAVFSAARKLKNEGVDVFRLTDSEVARHWDRVMGTTNIDQLVDKGKWGIPRDKNYNYTRDFNESEINSIKAHFLRSFTPRYKSDDDPFGNKALFGE